MADAKRGIAVKTPLGTADLLFARMKGKEEVSKCFSYHLVMNSARMDINAAEILGETVNIKIEGAKCERFFHGHVEAFGLTEYGAERSEYVAVVRPWFWFLSKTTDNRIFQNKSVIDIVEEVFGDYPDAKFEMRLQETYDPREYCVQYGESDMDFIQRLLEHEGIFYFFEHADGEHRMILTDAMVQLTSVPEYGEITYRADKDAGREKDECVLRWQRTAKAVSGSYTQTDYDLTKPAADLLVRSENPLGHSLDDGKLYHYPGNYVQIARGDVLAKVRTEEAQAISQLVRASGTTIGPWAGAKFAVVGNPRIEEDDEYMVLSAAYDMEDSQYRSGSGSGDGFSVEYELRPTSVVFRPERQTCKPIMRGPQTAVVVGPSGEEIFTDEYSRVKVQFHWDRLGGNDEKSSCFIRVSSPWAGSGWGFIQIPRIGQEVIVDFLEGDPDQPIITGRVYNAAQMPPYGLPGSATQSGWKSNSSPGGGGWNEMRFEDKKGSEEVYFQAEKDHNELVKNDESRNIGHDFLENVGNDATQNVGHDRTETVSNDKSVAVGMNRTVSIGVNDTETVGADRSLTVHGSETIQVDGNSSETIGGLHNQRVELAQNILVAAGRMDKVGLAEVRSVGGFQSTTVGLYRSVNVGSSQQRYVQSNDTFTVNGNKSTVVNKNEEVKVKGDQSFWIDGEGTYMVTGKMFHASEADSAFRTKTKLLLEGEDQVTIKCGSAVIVMKKDGTISVNGKDITVEGKDITAKGSGKINIAATGELTTKGSKINQN